jgi:hypothetical protein
MNLVQRRVLTVLERMTSMTQDDESYAEAFVEALEIALTDLSCQDTFGSEGSTDPRGDMREGEWSMFRVQGVDK